jgi:hypothetical protein
VYAAATRRRFALYSVTCAPEPWCVSPLLHQVVVGLARHGGKLDVEWARRLLVDFICSSKAREPLWPASHPMTATAIAAAAPPPESESSSVWVLVWDHGVAGKHEGDGGAEYQAIAFVKLVMQCLLADPPYIDSERLAGLAILCDDTALGDFITRWLEDVPREVDQPADPTAGDPTAEPLGEPPSAEPMDEDGSSQAEEVAPGDED